ncbi:hypothetical protein FH608_030440 [Nonomuraea phyllanthi]|uniref:HEXXH motif domain-containing protein n=1 Tax=Nonomuraea phyllanthi TaxID=2219224 RepID=A0A5C4W2I6_9ACTN|nr:HEXXH motif-containing putative peptide modification protein [Nonomuraea phyllanthi]KAB8191571.1 hypothetical protein FH608_030440 [Nonomuraea phyllanthi]
MTRGFELSRAALADLARGGAAPATLAGLTGVERGKNALLLRAVVARSAALGHPGARAAADGYRLLARVQRSCPPAAAQVLGYPLIGTWASATLGALARQEQSAAPQRLAAVAAGAVVLAGAAITVRFPAEAGAVALPGVGRLPLPGLGAGEPVTLSPPYLVVGGERIMLPRDPRSATAGPWQAVRDLGTPGLETPGLGTSDLAAPDSGTPALAAPDSGTRDRAAPDLGPPDTGLLLDDVDAWRFPGPIAPLDRLPDADAAAWAALITEARAVLAAGHPAVARALSAMTKVLVPITPPDSGTRSATSRTAYGSIAMSWPHDARSAAVTLTHEVQHAKLAVLMDLFDLVRPGSGGRFYAPWRDDPRPAAALLQGAYAHMGVAGFWRAERHLAHDPAHAEFVRWRDAAREACLTLLGSGTVTAMGSRFIEGMLETLAAWRSERVPAEASAEARQAATRHRALWSLRHGS